MKKILIKLLMLIGIMCMFIVCYNTTCYGKDKLEEYMIVQGGGFDDVVKGFYNMIKYVENTDYKTIAKENSDDNIILAITSIGEVTNSYFENCNDNQKRFVKELTGKEVIDFVEEVGYEPPKILKAAWCTKTNNTTIPNINGSYEELFKYNLENVTKYYNKFGYRFNNIKGNQIAYIKKLWTYKNSDDNKGTSIATRNDIFVNENDSYDTMMKYDVDQIRVYRVVYGTPALETGKRQEVLNQWSKKLSNENIQFDTITYRDFDDVSITKEATNFDNLKEKQPEEKEPDSDLGIAFQQPKRIEAKRRRRNSRCSK